MGGGGGKTPLAASTATFAPAIPWLVGCPCALCLCPWGLDLHGRCSSAFATMALPIPRIAGIEWQHRKLFQNLVLVYMQQLLLLGQVLNGLNITFGQVGSRGCSQLIWRVTAVICVAIVSTEWSSLVSIAGLNKPNALLCVYGRAGA